LVSRIKSAEENIWN